MKENMKCIVATTIRIVANNWLFCVCAFEPTQKLLASNNKNNVIKFNVTNIEWNRQENWTPETSAPISIRNGWKEFVCVSVRDGERENRPQTNRSTDQPTNQPNKRHWKHTLCKRMCICFGYGDTVNAKNFSCNRLLSWLLNDC